MIWWLPAGRRRECGDSGARGGFGEGSLCQVYGWVYKARDLHLDRFVALNFCHRKNWLTPNASAAFAQEAKSASALNHPNIIYIYDANFE